MGQAEAGARVGDAVTETIHDRLCLVCGRKWDDHAPASWHLHRKRVATLKAEAEKAATPAPPLVRVAAADTAHDPVGYITCEILGRRATIPLFRGYTSEDIVKHMARALGEAGMLP
jgi:hypothetical protein